MAEDKNVAVQWYHKAADQDYPDAEFNLGRCLHEGIGVKLDKAEALKWTEKAAKQGIVEAQMMVGINYWLGIDVKMDEAKGVKWFQKAAEQGEPGAFYYLGGAYYHGKGVKQDLVQSYKWGTLFMETDHSVITNLDVLENTRGTLADLETKLTPKQLSKAKRLVKEANERLPIVAAQPTKTNAP